MSHTFVAPRTTAEASVGLPISWYFDPDVLEIERRSLFATGPNFAGHASLAPYEGDYVVRGGRNAGMVLVRNEGRLRLLSNTCRHRQAELLTGSGCAKSIVCPVHNWTYDLNGRQIAAPHFPENPCLDLERTELVEWNALLFDGPRDVRRDLASLDGWTELSASDYVLVRVDEEEHNLNWKVFLEIYLEDYHIGVVHPGFRAFVDPSDVRGALQAVGGERFFCEQVNVRWPPAAQAGSPLFAEFQKILLDILGGARPPFAAIWLCLFNGQLVEWYPFSMVVTTYQPLSPTRTALRSEYYLDRRIAETRRDFVEVGLAVLDEVTSEDQSAAEMLQRGRQALYERGEDWRGPYQQPMEQGIRRFHDCLRRIIAG
jgi:phenylpropionate dioxygenase-like ring-hydroxylating dioxygenase large terminal subunit